MEQQIRGDDLEGGHAVLRLGAEDHDDHHHHTMSSDSTLSMTSHHGGHHGYLRLDSKLLQEPVVDLEAGQPQQQSDNMMEEELTSLDWAEALAQVDAGCWAKVKTGQAGKTPAEDSFSWFSSSHLVYLRILWDLNPSDYRLVSFPQMPKDAYDPDEYLHAKQIMVTDISEVYLEVEPSFQWRLYLNDGQVIRVHPLPQDRQHTTAWVDAVYAAMQLQNTEEDLDRRRQELDTSLAAGTGDNEQTLLEEERLIEEEALLRDLRVKFYELHPDLVNVATFGVPVDGISADQLDPSDLALVVKEAPPNSQTTLGGGEGMEAGSRNSSFRPRSFRLDFTQIYTKDPHGVGEGEGYNTCCIIH